jgi:hypothetical protein
MKRDATPDLRTLSIFHIDARYATCKLKRDGGGYRSTFTSAYPPPLAKGNQPPDNLREMEVMANRGFLSYLRHYFDYGVLSGYY